MSTEHSNRPIIVGIFIALGLAILVTGVMVLGGQQKRFIRTVQVMAIFNDVSGLKVGDNVWFSGVKIGTVRQIRIIKNARVEVDLNIEEKSRQYIRKDALCEIGSDGLIGNKVITIIGGTQRVAAIEAGDSLRTQAAVGSEQMLDTLQITNRKLLSIMTQVQQIVAQVGRGQGTAGALLTDPVLAGQMRATVASLETAAGNANRMSGTLADFTAKLDRRGTLAHELVTDTTVFNNLRASARELRRASTSAVGITDNARRLTDKLNSTDNALGSLLNDPLVNRNMQRTLQNLESGSKKLDDDLEAAQHNILLRGFFRRKEKEAAKQQKQSGQAPPADSARVDN